MKTLNAIAIFAISVAGVVHAQDASPDARRQAAVEAKQQFVGAASPDVATSCTYNFTSGTGNKFMKYCVTKNGNIAQFESPAGAKYISTSPVGEGYAFCDFDSRVQYSDYAGFGDSGNWQPPVTTSSSPTVVKISRTSSDGIYTLNQVITQNAGNAYAQVAMTLKNNSANPHHVGLLRWADVDAGGSPSNSFDYTFRTAMGYQQFSNGFEIQFVSGGPFNGAYSQIIPGGPDACQIFTHVVGPLANTDGSIFAQWDLQLGGHAAKSVIMNYRSF
jgi:hypothetical protein